MGNELRSYEERETYAEEIEKIAEGPIEAIVMGSFGWGEDYGREETHYPNGKPPDKDPIEKVLKWSQARPYLDYYYSDGYGAAECHAVYAWTHERVIYCATYDGSTWLTYVPRNPEDCKPGMSGGG